MKKTKRREYNPRTDVTLDVKVSGEHMYVDVIPLVEWLYSKPHLTTEEVAGLLYTAYQRRKETDGNK